MISVFCCSHYRVYQIVLNITFRMFYAPSNYHLCPNVSIGVFATINYYDAVIIPDVILLFIIYQLQ